MNAEERQSKLIEYAEGTLPKEQTADVEAWLNQSPDARKDLEIIHSAFRQLNDAPAGTVPDHYFTNFLPLLRQKIEHGRSRTIWTIPEFIERLIRPAMVVVGLILFVTAYRSFEPQQSVSPLYDLMREFAQEEISVVLDESPLLVSTVDESMSAVVSDPELLSDDAIQYQSENDLLVLLEEQDLEQVVQHLETRVIQ
jgi:hypothetical protein